MTRRRLGAAEWAVLIDEWKKSVLDLPEFCRRRGLSRGIIQGWVYKAALKRAIAVAGRSDRGMEAKASHEGTPAELAPSPAFLPIRFAEAAALDPFSGPGVQDNPQRVLTAWTSFVRPSASSDFR